ncbi:hypothetical protein N7466_005031 [Penicillium verhagenii]|uniref:uncharacterized protein n=1 Tax=Penicillium verhagenii TaxID=1562060 RepID=UPI00254534AC|nr:uncharacterized protein N7466_005031 [Penicillium verhagenii]KAJ5935484.1 hypothetical protein N7466_005031 [Penicillium verhagenii]
MIGLLCSVLGEQVILLRRLAPDVLNRLIGSLSITGGHAQIDLLSEQKRREGEHQSGNGNQKSPGEIQYLTRLNLNIWNLEPKFGVPGRPLDPSTTCWLQSKHWGTSTPSPSTLNILSIQVRVTRPDSNIEV